MIAPPVLRSSRISNASPLAVLLGLLLLPVALVGPNVKEVAYAAVILAVGLTILWRPAEPPIPLLVFVYQWIQAAMGPIYGNLSGLELNDLSRNLGEHNLAAWLELTGVLCLALGMRWAIGNRDFDLNRRIIAFVGSRPLGFWFRVYLAASIFGALCATFAYSLGGLAQPLLSLSQIKWAGYILLTFSAFAIRGNPKGIWIAVTLFEFVLSIGGFFSSFKDIFFYAALGLVGSGYRFRAPQLIIFAALGSLLLPLGVVWSAVKIPYRDFANGRTMQQSINVGYTERI